MFEFLTKLDNSKIGKLKIFQLKKIIIPMIFISIIIIACGVVNIVQDSLFLGITWIIVGILYMPSVFLFTKLSNKTDTSYKHLKYPSLYEKYFFDENLITLIQTDTKEINTKSEFKYDEIYKMYKSKDDYFLYINKERVHIIPASTLKDGQIEKFEEFLKSKLGKKYKKLLF